MRRVNLIAGDNNVGKTAVLEALWQFSGPNQPDLGPRLNQFREIQIDSEELLFDLFHNYDISRPIELIANGGGDHDLRRLTIEAIERTSSRIRLEGGNENGGLEPPLAESPYEIVLGYLDGDTLYKSKGWFAARPAERGLVQGFEIRQDKALHNPTCHFFSSRHRSPPQQEADLLGRIEIQGSAGLITDALCHLEPKLQRLTTVAKNGVPVIHADVGLGRLIPMGLLGDGIQRVLSIALACGNAPGGMVLVDELKTASIIQSCLICGGPLQVLLPNSTFRCSQPRTATNVSVPHTRSFRKERNTNSD